MKKRKKGGIGNIIVSVVWALLAVGGILAAVQALDADSAEGMISAAKEKAEHYAECIPSGECGIVAIFDNIGDDSNNSDNHGDSDSQENTGEPGDTGEPGEPVVDDVQLVTRETKGYRGPANGEPYVNNAGLVAKDSSMGLLRNLVIADRTEVEYDRAEWKHWASIEGRACWSVREEILHRDAEDGTLVYVDKQLNNTKVYEEACAIGTVIEEEGEIRVDTENSGEWVDPYSGKSITSSSDLDIDHIVPLNYAAENGGQSWDTEMKEQFANDPDNLLATSAKENRSKGAKGPSDYMPPYKAYRCQYAKSFTSIASKYELSITEKDLDVLSETLENCQF